MIDLPSPAELRGCVLQLVLEGVHKTAASLVLRVMFAVGGSAPIGAGDLYTYGESPAGAGAEASDKFQPMTLSLDVTAAVQKLGGARRIELSVQVLDHHGVAVDEALVVSRIELQSEPSA